MKKGLVIISILLCQLGIAQQLPQQTQYVFNQYAFNPAYAGSTDYWETIMNSRYQWIGITDAPRTVTMAAQGPFKNKKMGIGGIVYNDIVGPTRRLGFQSSYAYHLKLNESVKLSMALSFGFNQWIIDGDKIQVIDKDDQLFSRGIIRATSPDAKFGIYLYHKDWYFGAASPQLLHNNLKFKKIDVLSESLLEDHYFINAGYKIKIGSDVELEPNVLAKFGFPAPVKIDAGLKTTYKDMVWLGLGFRTQDAITMMLGYKHNENLLFGYSYDYTTTDLRGYNTGTHEVFFGIRFGKINQNSADSSL